ncbi:PE-PGRS family protein PE_PGRS47-like [Schistocerca americana]|uniref:PE-PGRS family protein PE_PGRS47-like n=1 Tax=Schistocerca americana TaxID=7009 RepID=UPI001F4FD268|nr:PE-PGRS family protein PE_PGRS47-like [Schistocerca americana]
MGGSGGSGGRSMSGSWTRKSIVVGIEARGGDERGGDCEEGKWSTGGNPGGRTAGGNGGGGRRGGVNDCGDGGVHDGLGGLSAIGVAKAGRENEDGVNKEMRMGGQNDGDGGEDEHQ